MRLANARVIEMSVRTDLELKCPRQEMNVSVDAKQIKRMEMDCCPFASIAG